MAAKLSAIIERKIIATIMPIHKHAIKVNLYPNSRPKITAIKKRNSSNKTTTKPIDWKCKSNGCIFFSKNISA